MIILREEDIRKREVFNRYLELSRKDAERFFADRNNFLEVACPACGSRHYVREFDKHDFTYTACTDCHTLFVNPRPPFNDLMSFYADSPSTTYWVEEFFKPVAEVRRDMIFRPRAEYVAEILPQLTLGVIGDIGAGFGLFLEELGELWPACRKIAIEPSLEQAEICRTKGLEVQCCSLEELEGYNQQFDLLTAFELFEHLYDPEVFLQKIYDLLKPGGHLFLTTLNGLGFDILILWEKSKSISPPHHLNFFNPESIELLLKNTGFTTVSIDTPGKLDWDIVEGMILEENMGTDRFWQNLARHNQPEAKQALQKWVSNYNFSSHMRVLAKKM